MSSIVQFDSKETLDRLVRESVDMLDVSVVKVQNLNSDFSGSLLFSEFDSALGLFVVLSSFSSLALIVEVNSSVLALDSAV